MLRRPDPPDAHLLSAYGDSIHDAEPNLGWFNRSRDPDASDPDRFDQPVLRSLGEGVSPAWQASQVPLSEGYTLVLR